jgi:hypothetical protein
VFLSTDGGTSWGDASGDLGSVRLLALALDPVDANTIYAGTMFGVWRTVDAGAHWTPFEDGLPNVQVMALRVAVAERELYAGTYGRGVWKTSIAGATVPAIELVVRDHVLDDGQRSPSPVDLPDPFAAAGDVLPWESVDIKIDAEPYAQPGTVFDGIEFDELVHDEARAGMPCRVLAQVWNRGRSAASDVQIRVFWARAAPRLPQLAPDFWEHAFDGEPIATAWHPVGPARTIARLEPDRPAVVGWDWIPPSVGSTHNCLLATTSCAGDPLVTTERDVGTLIARDRRAALKNVHVIGVETADDHPIHGELGLATVDLHNARYTDDLIDIVVDPRTPGRVRIGILLPRGKLRAREQLVRVKPEPLAKRLPGRWPTGFDPGKLVGELDLSTIYWLDARSRSEICGIPLHGGETATAVIACSGKSISRPEGAFVVMQRERGKIVGGCSYEIRPVPMRRRGY